jgi:hypothetical protein
MSVGAAPNANAGNFTKKKDDISKILNIVCTGIDTGM